jgi:hypothetical protein
MYSNTNTFHYCHSILRFQITSIFKIIFREFRICKSANNINGHNYRRQYRLQLPHDPSRELLFTAGTLGSWARIPFRTGCMCSDFSVFISSSAGSCLQAGCSLEQLIAPDVWTRDLEARAAGSSEEHILSCQFVVILCSSLQDPSIHQSWQ